MKHPRCLQHIAQCQRVAVIQMLGVFPQFGARLQTQGQFARRNPCFDFFSAVVTASTSSWLMSVCSHGTFCFHTFRHFAVQPPRPPNSPLPRVSAVLQRSPRIPRTARALLPRSTRPAQSSAQAESAKSTPRSSFTTPPSAAAAPDASAPASAPSPAPAAFPACSGTAAARPARPQIPARESAPSAS